RQRPPRTEDHGSFNDVLKLADISGVVVALQHRTSLGIDIGDVLTEFLRVMQQGRHAQWKNVFASLSERGKFQRDDIEAEKQVFSKVPGNDVFLEIPVRCGDETKVHRNVCSPAQTSKRPFL